MRVDPISSKQSVSRQSWAWRRWQRHEKRSDKLIATESHVVTINQETLIAETDLINRHQARFCGASTEPTVDLSMTTDATVKGIGKPRTRRPEYVEITWTEVMAALFTTGIIVFLLCI